MILLLFLLLIWSLLIVTSFLAAWGGRRYTLKRAHFVVVGSPYDYDSLRRVDVTLAIRRLGEMSKKVKLIPYLQSTACRGDLREALDRCRDVESRNEPQVRRTPLCFLDVEYSMMAWAWAWAWFFGSTSVYRCLYPVYSFGDYVSYPPLSPCLLYPRSCSLGMESASLTLRLADGSRQVGCNVTSRMSSLAGPLGDFHCHSAAGYQLRKHILRVVLMPDVWALSKALEDDSPSPSSDCSSNSLKSMALRPSMSIRFQIKLADKRLEVMGL